jgi:predicted small secreted protein
MKNPMKHTRIILTSLTLAPVLALTSCDTPEGRGAAIGAGSGAVLAALGHGRPEDVAAGAALGAGLGALIGHAVGRADDDGYYAGEQLPYGTPEGRGIVRSPYRPYNLVDTRGIPRGSVVEDPSTGGRFIKP